MNEPRTLKSLISDHVHHGPTTGIRIRALAVHQMEDGSFSIEVAGRELSADERSLLRNLFPNLEDKARDLLNKEALLEAMGGA